MIPVNFNDEFVAKNHVFEIVELQGKQYMFTNLRVKRDTIPEGLYAYDVADDCDGSFCRVQKFVLVNHWGTIIGKEPIEMETIKSLDPNYPDIEAYYPDEDSDDYKGNFVDYLTYEDYMKTY